MDLVIRISKEDLLAALNGSTAVKAEVIPTAAPKKEKKAKKVVEEEFDETEEEDAKPVKEKKKKAKAAVVVEEEDEEEVEEESEEEAEEETEAEEPEEEDEYISGDELAKLKKALNAHKAANGGKTKKTIEILRKYAPGGSEKVSPEAYPKLLKALKV